MLSTAFPVTVPRFPQPAPARLYKFPPLFGAAKLNVELKSLPFKTKKRKLTNVKLFTGRAFPELAKAVAKRLGILLSNMELKTFADGSIYTRVAETVRNKKVFIIQPTCGTPGGPSTNDNIMETMLMLDALRRSKSAENTVVSSFWGYSRGDRQVLDRESVPAKVVTDMLTNGGANHLATADIHNKAITSFTNEGFDNLYAMMMLAQFVKENNNLEDVVVVSPDGGGVKRAGDFANLLGADKYVGAMDKQRDKKTGEIIKMDFLGKAEEIRGKTVILPDDMIDTAGTMVLAADELLRLGAKKVIAAATHGFFNVDKKGVHAIDRINTSQISEVLIANTMPLSDKAKSCDKLTQVDISPMLAEAIGRMANSESLTDMKQ